MARKNLLDLFNLNPASNKVRPGTNRSVSLSVNEINSSAMQSGAEAANINTQTAGEKRYIKGIIDTANQQAEIAKKEQDKEIAVEQTKKVKAISKSVEDQTAEIKKIVDTHPGKQTIEQIKKDPSSYVNTHISKGSFGGGTDSTPTKTLTAEAKQRIKDIETQIEAEVAPMTAVKEATIAKNSQLAQHAFDTNSAIKEAKDFKNKIEKEASTTYALGPLEMTWIGKKDTEDNYFSEAYKKNKKDLSAQIEAEDFESLPGTTIKYITNSLLGGAVEFGLSVRNNLVDVDGYVEQGSKAPKGSMNYVDKERYEKSKEMIDTFAKPIAQGHKVKAKRLEITADAIWNEKVERAKAKGEDITGIFNAENIKHTFIKNRLKNAQEEIDNYIEGKGGSSVFLRNIVGKTMADPTSYITFLENSRSSWFDFAFTNEINKDLNERLQKEATRKGVKSIDDLTEAEFKGVFNTLDPLDQQVLLSKSAADQGEGFVSDKQAWGYRTVRDTGQSVDFIVGMFLGNKAISGIKNVFGITNATKSMSGLRSIAETARGASVSARTIATATNVAAKTAEAVGVGTVITAVNPRELTGHRFSLYKELKDKNGVGVAVFGREGAYSLMKRDIERDKITYRKIYDYLKQKEGTLTPEEAESLKVVGAKLGLSQGTTTNDRGREIPITTLDQDLEAYEVNSLGYVYGRGIVANTMENVSELYTMDLLRGVGGGASKLFGKPAKTVLEKVPAINTFIKSASGSIKNIEKAYATSALGRAQGEFNHFFNKNMQIDGKRVIGGLPEEVAEEYFMAFSDSLTDWTTQPLRDSFNTDFLSDVLSQTMLMQGTFMGMGGGRTVYQRAYANKYEAKLNKLDKEIAKMNAALTADPESKDTQQSILNLIAEKKALLESPSISGLNLTKSINKSHDGYTGMKKYLNNKAAITKSIDQLKRAQTDTEVNDILDAMDLGKTDTSTRVRTALELRLTGRIQEAEGVEHVIDREMIMKALSTNSEKDLQGAIEQLTSAKNNTITPEQKERFQNISTSIDEIIKFKEANKGKPNLDRATSLQYEKSLIKKGLAHIVNQRASIREVALEEFNSIFDTHFSNSDIDKGEALAAFISGDMVEEDRFEPIVKKIAETGMMTSLGYLDSFTSENQGRNLVSNLNIGIHESLNPTKKMQEGENLKEEFINYYEALHKDNKELIGELELSSAEFDADGKLIPSSKTELEIIDKLEKKYVEDKLLSQADFNIMKLKITNMLKAVEYTKQQIEAANERAKVEEANALAVQSETTQKEDPLGKDPLDTTIVVDADEVAEFNDQISDALAPPTFTLDEDQTSFIPGANAQDTMFSIAPGEDATLEAFKRVFTVAVSNIKRKLNIPSVEFMFVVEQMLKHTTPDIRAKLSNPEYLVRAWEALDLPISIKDKQEIFNRFASEEDLWGLENLPSIFAEVVSAKPDTFNTDVVSQNEKVNEEKTEITPETTSIATLPTIQALEEKEAQDIEKWVMESTEPIAIAARVLVDAGMSPLEALDMVKRGTIEEQKASLEDNTQENYFIPYLGYNAVPYEWYSYTDEQGRTRLAKRTIKGAKLNAPIEDAYIRPDFRDLLHPDMYVSGDVFDVEVASEEDWNKIIKEEILLEDGTKQVITFADWVYAQGATFRNSEEFKNHIPIFIKDKTGKRLAYIHDTAWYTPYSIPNPYAESGDESTEEDPSTAWLDYIEAHRQGTVRLREAISAGLTKVSIEKPKEGQYGKLQEQEQLISIAESNPQAQLFVQRGLGIEAVMHQIKHIPGFEDGSKVLLNSSEEFLKRKNRFGETVNPDGHTWAIYRIGTIVTAQGKRVETYRAIAVQRAVTEDQIETVKWAIAAHKTLKGQEVTDSEYRMTMQQAQDISSEIRKATGYSIANFSGIGEFMNMFISINTNFIKSYENEINAKRAEGKKKADLDAKSVAPYFHYLFESGISSLELINGLNGDPSKAPVVSQNTNNSTLTQISIGGGAKFVPKITAQGVEPYLNPQGQPMSYHDYIANTLYTNLKAFDMDTTGKAPVYGLVVQPKIEINYNNEDIDSNQAFSSATEISLRQATEAASQAALEQLQQEEVVETPSTIEDLNKAIDYLSELKVNYESYYRADNMFGSMEELEAMLDLTSGLLKFQVKAISGFIEDIINSKLGFRAKINSKTHDSIKAQAQIEFTSKVRPIIEKLNRAKEAVSKLEIEDPRKEPTLLAIQDTLTKIESVKIDFDSFFEKAMEQTKSNTKVELMEEDEMSEEDLETEKNYSKDSLEEKLKDKASAKMKMLMYGIPALDSKGNPITSYLGLNTYMSLNDMYNLILRSVSSNIDARADFREVMDKLAKNNHPSINIFLKRLEGADEQIKNQFINNVTAHALSSKFIMYDHVKGKTYLKIYDTNSSEITRQIKDRWVSNSAASNLYHFDGSFNTAFAQGLINRLDAMDKDYNKVPQEKLREWLEDLGIDFHDKTWERVYSQGITQKGKTVPFSILFGDTKSSLYGNLRRFLVAGIETPSEYEVASDRNVLSNLSGISASLSNIEADNNPELITLSYRDNGKSIFTLTPPKYVTDRVTELIRKEPNGVTAKLVDQMLSLSYSKNSIILKLLKTSPEMSDLLAVHHLSLSAIKDKQSTKGQGEITELSELDYDQAALGGFQDRKVTSFSTPIDWGGIPMRIANMLAPTMSDKSQGLFISAPVFDLLKIANEAFSMNEDGVLEITDIVSEALVEAVIRPEVERIVNFHNKVKTTGIKNYNTAAGMFHTIPALNTIQKGGKNLVEFLASPQAQGMSVDLIMKEVGAEFNGRIRAVVAAEAKKKNAQWKEAGLVVNEKTNVTVNHIFDDTYFKEAKMEPVRDFEMGTLDFVVNSLMFQSEVSKVFTGDIAVFSENKNWDSAIKEASARDKVNHTAYTLTTADYIGINKKTGVNMGKRLAYLLAPGKKLNNSVNDSYNQIFLEDPKDITENALDLIELYYGKAARINSTEAVTNYKEKEAALSSLQELTSPSLEQIQEKEALSKSLDIIKKGLKTDFPNIAGYFDLTSADAQEYTTITEHLEILNRIGRINKEQMTKILNTLASNKDLDYEDLELVLQPIKPVHTGMYVDENNDMARVVYIKSSSFPLIPQFTRGLQLDNLRLVMEQLESETGRFTRASYQSANKVGAVVNPINPLDNVSLQRVFDHKFDSNSNINSPMLVLDRNNFRIQQDVPFKSNKHKQDTVAMGTQIFKLLFGDGMIREKFMWNGKPISGKALYEKYEQSFSKIIDIETKRLFSDLGVSEDGIVTDDKAFMIKLRDVLEKEATDRGYPIKEIKALKLVELMDQDTKEAYLDFTTPLWISPNSNKYEALLNSLVTNRVMQFKIPGNGFIAGAETGFKKKDNFDSMSKEDRNKIIYLKGWNGKELQGTKTVDGGVQKAQVMVASKFKNSKNELIDLFEGFNEETGEGKYVFRNATGDLNLKEDMIDSELFNVFSFRTPTSSHVSGSSIEIVGILPYSAGDLMIVPKNFTQQKGLDFDIDKESAYGFNHYIDENGKIKLMDSRYLDGVLSGDIRLHLVTNPNFDAKEFYENRKKYFSERKESMRLVKTIPSFIKTKRIIESEIEELKYIQEHNVSNENLDYIADRLYELEAELELGEERLTELYDQLGTEDLSKKEFDAKVAELTEQYENRFAELEDVYFKEVVEQHTQNLEKKLAQNDFVKVHLAVYNSDSPAVQRKINKILSMDVASEQAKKLARWKEEGVKAAVIADKIKEGMSPFDANAAYEDEASNFTMFSYSYQKAKMDLGAIGKMAIGIYAVATTFNGLIQTKFTKDGASIDHGKPFVIGNFTSTRIGAENSLKPQGVSAGFYFQRSLSEVFAEKENTATDNEKEQILGRVGVDEMTIGVDAFLTARGFDIDEEGNSIPYQLLSQPAVVAFNKKLKDSKGVLGEYVDKLELISDTIAELSEGTIFYAMGPDFKYHFYDKSGKILEGGSSALTGKNLQKGIKSGKAEGKIQAQAFMTFIQIEEQSNKMIPIMSALNTNALGKSIPEALLKHEKMGKALIDPNSIFPEFSTLVGVVTDRKMKGSYPFEFETGEGIITKYVRPTTPQGKIAVTGLHLGKQLFGNLFIYNEPAIQTTIKKILYLQGIGEEYVTAKNHEDVVKELKKFLYSNPRLTGGFKDANLKRFELFMDTENNQSLSMYIHETLKAKGSEYAKSIEALQNNALLGKRLKYRVGKGENAISTIVFNNTASDSLSEEELYAALPDLVIQNLPLPPRNGKPYSTRDLVEDLVQYSFLEGGIQEANQFIKFIPVELLSAMGQINPRTNNFVSVNSMLQTYNPRRVGRGNFANLLGLTTSEEKPTADFVMQFFQNNPTLAPRLSFKDVKINLSNKGNETLDIKRDSKNEFVREPKELMHFVDRDKNVYLFRHVGKGQYVAVDTNKIKGISQYELGKPFMSNLNGDKVKQYELMGALNQAHHDFKYTPNMTIQQALEQVATLPMPKEREYLKHLATLFSFNITENNEVKVAKTGARGANVNGSITLDLNYLLSPNTTNELVGEVLVHEMTHTLTVKELNSYFADNAETGEYELKPEYQSGELPLPTHVSELLSTFNTFLKKSGIDTNLLQELKAGILKLQQGTANNSLTIEERRALVKDLTTKLKEQDFRAYYAATNIKEFMATLFESEEFRQTLDKIEYKRTGKSLLEAISDAILKFLDTVFPGLKNNHLAKESLLASFRFMEKERKFIFEKNNSVSLSDLGTEAQQLNTSETIFGTEGIESPNEDEDEDSSPTEEETGPGDLSISQEEWDNLSTEEKQKIKDCN